MSGEHQFMVLSDVSGKMIFSNEIQLPDCKQVEEGQLGWSKVKVLPCREV